MSLKVFMPDSYCFLSGEGCISVQDSFVFTPDIS